jgi:hypothetical protein
MNIPILLGVDGETRELIESYHAGIYFEPENKADFLTKIRLIRAQIEDTNPFATGCQALARDYDRKYLARKMYDIMAMPN